MSPDEGHVEEPEGSSDQPARRRLHPRLVALGAAGVVLAMLLTAVGWFWHWHTHPDVFSKGGGSSVGALVNLTRQPTVYVGVTFPQIGSDGIATVDSISPHLTRNTAAAGFGFYICEHGSVGVVRPGDLDENCPDLVPVVRGTKLDVSEAADQQLVMGVTVHRTGDVQVNGVDITYTHGWQHGTQQTGLVVRLEALDDEDFRARLRAP